MNVFQTGFVEGIADGRDLTVHHGRGRNHVGPSLGLADRHPAQQLKGCVVVHLLAVQDATVAVGGELAEADVGDDGHVGDSLLNDADGLLDDAAGVVRLGPKRVFVGGNSE